MAVPNNVFTGYSPTQLRKLAQSYGYNEANLDGFGKFLEENPARAKQYFDQQNMDMFGAERMQQFQQGGLTTQGVGQQNRDSRNPYGFTSPPANVGTTAMLVPYYNQKTGERWTAPSGGWSPPSADWTTDAYGSAGPVRAEMGFPSPQAGQSVPTPFPQMPMSVPDQMSPDVPQIGGATAARVQNPQLPVGAAFQSAMTPFEQAQLMGQQTGQLSAAAPQVTQAAQVTAAQAAAPTVSDAQTMTAAEAAPSVQNVALQAAQQQAPSQLIEAAQQTETNVANLQAAQLGQAVEVQSPAKRALETGELVSSAVGQAAQAATFVEQAADAATATPTASATVQGQLAGLMQQFEDDAETPVWARGAIRIAQQEMAKRGLGASSMAGQAMVDAAMERAISIAQIDALVIAGFEKQNLSNRQQMATLKAQYRASFMNQEFDQAFKTRVQNAARISDIADRNFTAEQQVALENSKLAQTVDLENLRNQQALVIANASTLANLETTNLNNRQKAAVENAKNFLQIDVGNLNNAQQAATLSYQQLTQSLLTDAAQENAARKLNVTEANQTDRFFSELVANIGRFNAEQANVVNRANAGELNALQRYNSELINGREQFNARNQLAIEQSNAVWRREIATADTAAINFQNQFNAQNLLNISQRSYDNLWQEYRDVMELAWQTGENELNRIQALELAALQAQNAAKAAQYQAARQNTEAVGGFIVDMFGPAISGWIGGLEF